MSELAGKSTLALKAKELGLELDGPQLNEVVETLKHLDSDQAVFLRRVEQIEP